MAISGIGFGGVQPALAALPRVQNSLSRDVKALSTGLRVNTPGDDPSAFVQSANVQTQISSRQAVNQTLSQYSDVLNTTESDLESATSIVQKIRTLSVEANSTLESTANLKSIQQEVTQLVDELDAMSTANDGNGAALFNPQPPYVPTLVQTQTTVAPGAAPTSTVTFNLAQSPTAGNVLVVALGNGNGSGGGLPPPLITPPAGWVLQATADNSLDNGLSIYTHVVAAGDPSTYAFSFTPGDLESGTIAELSDVNPQIPFAAGAIQETYPPATVSTPTIQTTQAGELALGFHEINGYANPGGTVSGSGWTEIGSVYQIYHPFEAQISSLSTAGGQNLVSSYTFGPGSAGPGESAIIVINPNSPTVESFNSPDGDEPGEFDSVNLVGIDPITLGLASADVTAAAYTQVVNGTTVHVAAGSVLAETAADSALQYLASAAASFGAAGQIAETMAQNNALETVNDQRTLDGLSGLNIAVASSDLTKNQTNQQLLMYLMHQSNLQTGNMEKMFALSIGEPGQLFSGIA